MRLCLEVLLGKGDGVGPDRQAEKLVGTDAVAGGAAVQARRGVMDFHCRVGDDRTGAIGDGSSDGAEGLLGRGGRRKPVNSKYKQEDANTLAASLHSVLSSG